MLLHFLVFETHLASCRRIILACLQDALQAHRAHQKRKKVFCVLPGEHVDAHANAHDDEDDDEDDDDNDADDEALYVNALMLHPPSSLPNKSSLSHLINEPSSPYHHLTSLKILPLTKAFVANWQYGIF